MIENERDNRNQRIIEAARQIMTAARTAPKGKGIDILEICMVQGDELEVLAKGMEQFSEESGMKFFLRDALNVRASQAVVLIGTRSQVQGLNCKHCGFDFCEDKPEDVPCAINSIDVGIALGSAVSRAADLRVDSRIMYSAGKVAQRLAWLGEGVKEVFAILLSCSSKSPYFDRKSPEKKVQ